jgi:hypothetical protein
MNRKAAPRKKKLALAPRDLISASYCVLSEDAVNGKDESVSLFRLIDDIRVPLLPVMLNKVVVVFEFMRNTDYSPEEFHSAQLKFKLQLINPAGTTFPLGEYAPNPVAEKNGWTTHRLLMEIPPMSLKLMTEGDYFFRAVGQTVTHTEDEELISRRLRVQIIEPVHKIE